MSTRVRWDAGYPSKKRLTESDMLSVLRVGPPLEWFRPFAVLGEVQTDHPNRMRYGLVHWFFGADGNPRSDVRTFYSVEDARWAVDWLYITHPEDCRCVAVFYWEPATVNVNYDPLDNMGADS